MTEPRTRRDLIIATVRDAVSDLLYYDRKEDADLPRGAIQEAIAAGEISVDEIVGLFRSEVQSGVADTP